MHPHSRTQTRARTHHDHHWPRGLDGYAFYRMCFLFCVFCSVLSVLCFLSVALPPSRSSFDNKKKRPPLVSKEVYL